MSASMTARVVRSPMSFGCSRIPIKFSRLIGQHTTTPVEAVGDLKPEKGFEPLAPGLQDRCSDQLSYSGAATS